MEIPLDVIDYILSLLRHDPRTLLKCSDSHPILAQIVERHLYYHIIIPIGRSAMSSDQIGGHKIESRRIIELLSEAPHIVDYVRILEISFDHDPGGLILISPILSQFDALRCIKFTPWTSGSEASVALWKEGIPQCFKAALDGCLRLPTLQEVTIDRLHFPISMLNDIPNITRLALMSKTLDLSDCGDTPFPQLESLSVYDIDRRYSPSLNTWLKCHIVKLRSLTCDYLNLGAQSILELLGICSDTLENLDIVLKPLSPCEFHSNFFWFRNVVKLKILADETAFDICQLRLDYERIPPSLKLDLSSLRCLRHLTIRVAVNRPYLHRNHPRIFDVSSLPAAVGICKSVSRLQHLTLDLFVGTYIPSVSDIDLSPLADLARSTASFTHIDLYMHSSRKHFPHKFADALSELAKYEGVGQLVERGALVLHVQRAAPTDPRFIMGPPI